MRLLRRCLTLLTLLIVSTALPVQAQTPVRLDEMSVALWPEYDRPGVLVIYSGTLAEDVPLPVTITFAIPASVGTPSATAGVDDLGSFRYRKYELRTQGDRLLVSYSLPYRRFQMEYYIDLLAGQGSDKEFTFTYQADYPVRDFRFEVQEPLGASGFQTEPAAGSVVTEAQLPLHLVPIGALEQGQSASVTVRYQREERRLSAEILGVPTPGPAEFEDAPRAGGGIPTTTAIVLGGSLIAVGLALGLWMWTRSRVPAGASRQARRYAERRTAGRKAKRASRRPAAAPKPKPGDVVGYCHQCGRPLKRDEVYCPNCGTRRKLP